MNQYRQMQKFTSNLKRQNWLGTFILFIALMPSFYYSFLAIQEPWSNDHLAKAYYSLQQGQITSYRTQLVGYREEHLAGRILSASIIDSSQWPIDWLAVMPIGSLGIILVYYALARSISDSKINAYALMIFAGWYFPRLGSQYGLVIYGWVHTLFLGFLIFFWKWIESRKSTYSMMILTIFIVTFLFYQTTPLWILSIMVAGEVGVFIRDKIKRRSQEFAWGIPVFMFVFYFFFDTVFYQDFLNRLLSDASNEALNNYFLKILSSLFRRDELTAPFVVNPISPELATWTTFISYSIFVLPIAAWIIIKFSYAYKKHNMLSLFEEDKDIFAWTIIIAVLIHTIGYLGYGVVSLRLIPLTFPVVILIVSPKKWVVNSILVLLAIISVVGLISYISVLTPDFVKSELGISTQFIPEDSNILADPTVYSVTLMDAVKSSKLVKFTWMTPNIYTALVNNQTVESDFIFVDKLNKPITISGWGFLESWLSNITAIEENRNFNKVYENDKLILFQNNRSNISPSIENSQKEYQTTDWLIYFLRIVACMLFLILPGAIIFYLISDNLVQCDALLASGISFVLGVSVFVLIGYFSNFVIKNLIWLNRLALLFLILETLIFAFLSRKKKALLNQSYIKIFAEVVIILVAFGGVTTATTFERVNKRLVSTETYLTETHPGIYCVNIKNNTNRTINYSLYVGEEIMRNATPQISFELQPYQLFSATTKDLHIETDQQKRISWLVKTQDKAYTLYINLPSRHLP